MKINIVTLTAAVTFSLMSPLALAAGDYGDTSAMPESDNDRGTLVDPATAPQERTTAPPRPQQPGTHREGRSGQGDLNAPASPAPGQPGSADAQRQQMEMEQERMKRGGGGVDRDAYEEPRTNMK